MGQVHKIVEKAYASRILQEHSRWAKVLNAGDVKKPRVCCVCQEVLTVGYDPTELDIFGHQYDKLIEAGMTWATSPARIEGGK